MKLKKMVLHRVGQYTENTSLCFENGFNLVYGPNESGKSTFLAGFRGMLFGKVFLADEIIAIPAGAFGYMLLGNEDGQVFQVERSLAKKSPPKVTFPDGTIRSGISVLTDVFPELQQVEELLFRSIFTFQLRDLQGAGKDDGLQKSIYGTSGFSELNPAQIEADLEERSKVIFLPRKGSKRPLNNTLLKLDEVEMDLRKAHDKPDDYKQINEKVANLQMQIAAHEQTLSEVEEQYAFIRLVQTLAKPVKDWQMLELQIGSKQGLPAYDSARVLRMEGKKSRLEELLKKRGELQNLHAETMQSVKREVVSDDVIEMGPAILRFQQQFSAVVAWVEQINKQTERITDIEKEQGKIKAQLSDVWTEDRLSHVPLSATLLESVKSLDKRLEKCRAEALALRRSLQEKSMDEVEAKEPFGTLGYEDSKIWLKQRKTEIQQQNRLLDDEESRTEVYGSLVAQLEQFLRDLASNQQLQSAEGMRTRKRIDARMNQMKFLGYFSSVLFAALSAWLIYDKQSLPGTMGIALSALLAVGASVIARHSSGNVRRADIIHDEHVSPLEERISALNRQLDEIEQSFSLVKPSSRAVSSWVEAKRVIAIHREEMQINLEQTRNLERAFERWAFIIRQASRTRVLQEQILQEEIQITNQFERIITGLFGIPEFGLELPGFLREADLVLEWRRLDGQKAEWICERESLNQQVNTFCQSVAVYVQKYKNFPLQETESESACSFDFGNQMYSIKQIGDWIENAAQELEKVKLSVAKRQELLFHAELQKKQLEEITREISGLESEFGETFQGLSVDNWDDYLQIVEQMKAVDELNQRALQLWNGLLVQCGGSAGKLQESIQFLAGRTEDELADARKACGEKVETLRQEIRGMIEERALLKQQVKELETVRETERLTWEKASLVSARDKFAFDWAVMTTARAIARMARESWEEDNQPLALKWASSIFEKITDGKYRTVKSRMDVTGAPILYCTGRDGQAMDARMLSRGTREQLYLSLRLAMIEIYRERNVLMPIILDDPMVNFDLERTVRYFKVMHAFSENHQLIYLTCHRQIVDLAIKNLDVNLIEL